MAAMVEVDVRKVIVALALHDKEGGGVVMADL